jgi:hypothetical protein
MKGVALDAKVRDAVRIEGISRREAGRRLTDKSDISANETLFPATSPLRWPLISDIRGH